MIVVKSTNMLSIVTFFNELVTIQLLSWIYFFQPGVFVLRSFSILVIMRSGESFPAFLIFILHSLGHLFSMDVCCSQAALACIVDVQLC